MKGVIYARYSSDNQREESIEGQLRECKDYAERNGITILGTYIDRALSAKTDNRPEFQKMIKDSAKESQAEKAALAASGQSSWQMRNTGKTELYFNVREPKRSFNVTLRSQTPGIAVTKELVDFVKETPGISYKLN